ncbi:MAG: HDIG domain-containing protein [Armatimonadetes bacterium]|nr:HDIG domain-containing protein [Armatimonadota bacterium]
MKQVPEVGHAKTRWSRAGILLATFAVVTITMTINFSPHPLHLKIGDVCPRDYEAPRTVEYINQRATEQEKEKAAKSVGIIYRIDFLSIQQAEDAINGIFKKIREAQYSRASKIEKLSRLKKAVSTQSSAVEFSLEVFATCLAASPSTLSQLEITTKQIVQQVMKEGIRENGLVKARQDVRRMVGSLPLSGRHSRVIEEFAQAMIQPNLVPNWEETERRQQEKMAAVEPVKTVVRRGQIIIHRGEVVQRSHLLTLQALGLYLPQIKWLTTLGLTLLMGLMLLLVGIYVRQGARRYYSDPRTLLLLSTILVLTLLVSKLLFVYCGYFTSNAGYFTAVPAAAMLVAVLLNGPLAFMTTVVLSVLQGVLANFDLRFAVVALVTGIVAIFSVGKVSKRSDLTGASLILCATNGLTILIFGLIRDEAPRQLLSNAAYGLLNGLGCAIFTIGVLPFLEHLFRITTPMKLLELSDPSEPLLRRLLVEAPGTYHHSILVANLADNAAQAIGANGLLARVGAYYHDVGKLRRPYMFAENQFGGENPHDWPRSTGFLRS